MVTFYSKSVKSGGQELTKEEAFLVEESKRSGRRNQLGGTLAKP